VGPLAIRRLAVGVAAVPVVCGIIASMLFVLAGGFGGGHGRHDFAIGLLGLPAMLVLEQLPIPAVFARQSLLTSVFLTLPVQF